MKRLILTLAILVALTSQAFAWVTVVKTDNAQLSVNEDTILHYVAKGGFPATEAVISFYNYRNNGETVTFVRINDENLSYVEVSSCFYLNGVKNSCDATQRFKQVYRGSQGEYLMQWIVNYGRKVRGQDAM